MASAAKARQIVRIVWLLAGVFAVAFAVVLISSACLPELGDLHPIPDATDETAQPAPTLACGDGFIETLDDGGDSGESCDPGEAGAGATAPPGCKACAFECQQDGGVLDDAGGHCYFLVEPTADYSTATGVGAESASNACNRNGAHVVTLASAREAAVVASLVGDAGAYWVGLTKTSTNAYRPPVETEPGWLAAACPGCFALGANDAGAFAVHPNAIDASTSPLCLVSENNLWLQVSCIEGGTKYVTVCEREAVGQRMRFCGGLLCTTVTATVGSKRYVIVLTPTSATEASAFCTNNYEDGKLAVLATHEEREQLVREILLQEPPPDKGSSLTLWIGLTKTGGSWMWDDGQPESAYASPWGNEQPLSSGAGQRAFLRIVSDGFDTQLAYSDDEKSAKDGANAMRPFVCQRSLK